MGAGTQLTASSQHSWRTVGKGQASSWYVTGKLAARRYLASSGPHKQQWGAVTPGSRRPGRGSRVQWLHFKRSWNAIRGIAENGAGGE